MTARSCVTFLAAVAPALAAAQTASPPAVDVHQGAAVTVTVKQTLKASPAKVWGMVTSQAGLAALTGIAPDKEGKLSVAKVGDGWSARLPEWNDPGHLVVTTIDSNRRLHLTWEPDSGKYLGQIRISLEPAGTGTTLTYSDRYTDEKPKAAEEAKRIGEKAQKAVSAFRVMVEK
jgi:uncharacterized protein YndB with AHSA1/START domain